MHDPTLSIQILGSPGCCLVIGTIFSGGQGNTLQLWSQQDGGTATSGIHGQSPQKRCRSRWVLWVLHVYYIYIYIYSSMATYIHFCCATTMRGRLCSIFSVVFFLPRSQPNLEVTPTSLREALRVALTSPKVGSTSQWSTCCCDPNLYGEIKRSALQILKPPCHVRQNTPASCQPIHLLVVNLPNLKYVVESKPLLLLFQHSKKWSLQVQMFLFRISPSACFGFLAFFWGNNCTSLLEDVSINPWCLASLLSFMVYCISTKKNLQINFPVVDLCVCVPYIASHPPTSQQKKHKFQGTNANITWCWKPNKNSRFFFRDQWSFNLSHEKKPCYFPLEYWLFNRDPHIGLL